MTSELTDLRGSPLGDMAAGIAGGMVATALVAVLMQLSAKAGADPAASDAAGEPRIGSPDAATEAVDRLAQAATGHEVPDRYEQAATGAFQFAFGAALGAAYGLAARYLPAATTGRGTLFGTAVWAAFDEMLVPVTGLSGKPADSPLATHASALGVHLVFGAAVEAVRGALSRRR